MPLRTQGYCGVGSGLSGLHWVWCNRRGPHLEWRQEPQGSSPFLTLIAGSLQSINNLSANPRELRDEVLIPGLERPSGWEDPLAKEMATHSSILAWRVPWTEEPGGLQSMGSQRVGHD